MKKIFVCVLMVFIVMLSGCSGENTSEDTPKQTENKTVVLLEPLKIQELSCLKEKTGIAPLGTLKKEIKNKRIETNINDLTAYDYNDFINAVFPGMYCYPPVALSSHVGTIGQFNQYFPIEYFSVINEDVICVVYKLKQDEKVIYSYVIFERSVYEGPEPYDYTETWNNAGEFYLYTGDFSYDDFSEIKIDTELSQHRDLLNCVVQGSLAHSFNSVIMLNDGILVLNYSSTQNQNIRNAANPEEFVIKEICFYPYGKKTYNFIEDERGSILADGFYPELPDYP
ncbi:MAG: hypothetical protein IJD37_04595 [Clostridia bacterium]|nr:hypothetical protein [Clostridia bacterium]